MTEKSDRSKKNWKNKVYEAQCSTPKAIFTSTSYSSIVLVFGSTFAVISFTSNPLSMLESIYNLMLLLGYA